MTLRFKHGIQTHGGLTADEVGRIINEILRKKREEAGDPGLLLQPQDLIDAAEPPESELHDLFEWDDTIAARKWRLSQARKLIKSIEVIIEPRAGSLPVGIPNFIHVSITDRKDDEELKVQGYTQPSTLKKIPEHWKGAIHSLRGNMVNIACQLEDFAKIIPSDAESIKEVKRLINPIIDRINNAINLGD